ncbi:MAG: hypothetical protein JO033_10580 [Acidobacteriaceae bacterium]|nr:hypothetical protein [Acidobacteriaceae bacterium]MBV9500871.1 hypothetical protein [Acidobacteriaceae bacterium]
MPHTKKSKISSHTKGTHRGEEVIHSKGPEPGRETGTRTARDSTSINPKARDPIDPRMPHMPPP